MNPIRRVAILFLIGIPLIVKTQAPVKVVVVGVSHGHSSWILSRLDKGGLAVVGIYDPDTSLAYRYARQYNFDPALIYANLDTLLERTKPSAAMGFGAIDEHLPLVRACAPRKVHVMVEKPLAPTLKEAEEIAELSALHGIQVLVNYETSWYTSNERIYELVEEGKLGTLRRVIVNDGHQGPREIGVKPEFFNWLTDPKRNGGGAIMDFGCYGANLMTWLMRGQKPISVTAHTAQYKPNIYPRVDDEATIILRYPSAQCVVQASWNWPYNRKDMEVYGTEGYAIAVNRNSIRQRIGINPDEVAITLNEIDPYTAPFDYLAKVVRGEIKPASGDLSSLELNMTVMEILEAAKKSARTGRTVILK